MIEEKDWLMRQINLGIATLALLIVGKIPSEVEIVDYEKRNTLWAFLSQEIEAGRINEAEEFLFEQIEEGNAESRQAALFFYMKLNSMEGSILEAHNFSHEEVLQGLSDIEREFGLSIS